MLLVALLPRDPLLLRRGLLPRDFLLQRPLLLLLLPLQQQRRRRANASNESVRAVGGSPSSPRSFAAPSSVLPSRPAPSLPPQPRPAAFPAEAGVRRCRAPHRPRASARPRCRRARLAGPGASAGPRAGRRVCAQGRAALGSTAPGTVGLNAHSRLINNQEETRLCEALTGAAVLIHDPGLGARAVRVLDPAPVRKLLVRLRPAHHRVEFPFGAVTALPQLLHAAGRQRHEATFQELLRKSDDKHSDGVGIVPGAWH